MSRDPLSLTLLPHPPSARIHSYASGSLARTAFAVWAAKGAVVRHKDNVSLSSNRSWRSIYQVFIDVWIDAISVSSQKVSVV